MQPGLLENSSDFSPAVEVQAKVGWFEGRFSRMTAHCQRKTNHRGRTAKASSPPFGTR